MANNCIYDMVLTGPREALENFARMARYEDEKNCFHRVFSADCDFTDGGSMSVFGDCAWSFAGCFLRSTEVVADGNGSAGRKVWNLDDWCRENGCSYEAWSEEPGVGFVEHSWHLSDDDCGCECEDAEWDWDEDSETYGQVVKPESYGEFKFLQ